MLKAQMAMSYDGNMTTTVGVPTTNYQIGSVTKVIGCVAFFQNIKLTNNDIYPTYVITTVDHRQICFCRLNQYIDDLPIPVTSPTRQQQVFVTDIQLRNEDEQDKICFISI